jgi:hypothetical protein
MKPAPRWLKYGLAAVFGLLLLWQGWYLGWVLWWKWVNPGTTSFQSQRLDEARQKNPKAELKRQWVPYEKISIHLKRAVIAAEDDKFVDHEGFDWEGIQKALEKNQKKGKVVAGGSTISQQLAKNLLLSPTKTFLRKGRGSHHHGLDRTAVGQAAHPRGLSQRRRMGRRRVRRRGRRAALFQRLRGPARGGTGGTPRRHAAGAAPLRTQSVFRLHERTHATDPRPHAQRRSAPLTFMMRRLRPRS